MEEIYNDIVELENDIDKLEKIRQQVSDSDAVKKKKEVERKMRTLRKKRGWFPSRQIRQKELQEFCWRQKNGKGEQGIVR
jgi:cell fate (sporulation/competence/biofilm development) regulator YlbF (YheA/YmcA/DUF963 family)